MAKKAQTVAEVILGEALSVNRGNILGAYEDMLAIASVVANRAQQLGVSPQDVVAKQSEFNAYDKALPEGAEKNMWMAEQALAEVAEKGPVHNATFFATPAYVDNLKKNVPGLVPVTSTRGHQYFSDPQNRSIYTAQGLTPVQQVPTQVAGMQVGASTYDPMSTFMSAITPPSRTPSLIDRVFPGPAMPSNGPRRDSPIPSFMSGALAGVGRAAGAARDAVFPGAADRRAWQSGDLDPIDVETAYKASYGPQRPNDPNQNVMDFVKAQTGSYFGPGYTVKGFSGEGKRGPKDKSQHVHGKALDFDVIGPNGKQVTDKETMYGFIEHMVKADPSISIGYDQVGYMGPGSIHIGLDGRAKAWGPNKSWTSMDPALLERITMSRQAAMNAPMPVPSPAPRGGLATGQELAAERKKMVEAYAPYQQSTQTRAAPKVGGSVAAGYGKSGATSGALSPAAVLAGQYGMYRPGTAPSPLMMSNAPALPSLPAASKRPGAVAPGVRPSLPAAGLPAARQSAVITPNKVQTISFGRSGVPTIPGGSKQAIQLGRAYSQYADQRNRAPAVAPQRPAAPSRSVSAPPSPNKEFDRLVTSAGIPSLPTVQRTDESMRFAPSRPAAPAVSREAPKAKDTSFIPGGSKQAIQLDRAYSQHADQRNRAPATIASSPARSDMQRWSSPPPAPTRAAPAPARTADFRQSPEEARAQQLNMMHDQIVKDNPLPSLAPARQQTPLRGSISMPADSVINRQAPASIAGVPAPKSVQTGPVQSNTKASFDEATRIGLSPKIGMQADKIIAETVIAAAPALAAAAKAAAPALQMAKPGAVGPTQESAKTGKLAAPVVTAPRPQPSGPTQNGSVVTTQTAGGGVRSVDTRTGWSSYTDPTTGVTTTFMPGGDYSVGGGQGMVGSGNGGGFGGK